MLRTWPQKARPSPRGVAIAVMAASTGRPENVSGTVRTRAVALAIVAAAGMTTGALAMGEPGFLSPVIVAFVLVCPGLAIVRLLELREPLLEAVLGITLSVSLAGLVAEMQLYLGAWSPAGTVAILVALTIGAALLDPVLVPRWVWLNLGRKLRARGQSVVQRGRAIAAVRFLGQADRGGARSSVERSGPGASPGPVGGAGADVGSSGTALPSGPEPLPLPPVAVVHRRPIELVLPPVPRSKSRRRVTLGIDPLEQTKVPRAVRTAIDIVVDDLEDQRDEAGS